MNIYISPGHMIGDFEERKSLALTLSQLPHKLLAPAESLVESFQLIDYKLEQFRYSGPS
jgi:hypothetical protein